MRLALTEVEGNSAYSIDEKPEEKPETDLGDRILELLKTKNTPMSLRSLRKELGGDIGKYKSALLELKDDGVIEKTKKGWQVKQEESKEV